MGLLRALVGSDDAPARAEADGGGLSPRLAVKTRCLLVADVVAIDADGRRETVASGLDEAMARDLFLELTGRPWTRDETDN